jgi:hypothetical protein
MAKREGHKPKGSAETGGDSPPAPVLIGMGLAFFAGGLLFMIGVGIRGWVLYFESGNWDRVEAQIAWAELKVHPPGGRGEDTYSVKCHYTYSYGGRAYKGARADLDEISSSEDYHARRVSMLVRYKEEGKPASPIQTCGLPCGLRGRTDGAFRHQDGH